MRLELSLCSECGVSFGPPSLARLSKRWNRFEHRLAVDSSGHRWWQGVSKEAFSSGMADTVTAYWNWQKSSSGSRAGCRVGFPRFRRKGRDADRYRTTTGSFGVCGRRHVKLPRIVRVRTHRNTSRLHRLVELGGARILKVAVRRRRRRLLAVFTVVLARPQANMIPKHPASVVGVVAGVLRLATAGDGSGRTLARLTAASTVSDLCTESARNARRVLSVTDQERMQYRC